MKIVLWMIVVAYLAWGTWIVFGYKGNATSERWEWAIGTHERTGHWHQEP